MSRAAPLGEPYHPDASRRAARLTRRAVLAGGAPLLLAAPARAADILGCRFRDAGDLLLLDRERGCRLLDAGSALLAALGAYYAPPVAVRDLPPHLVDALVTSEDKGFFEHGGLDYLAILRAAARDLLALGVRQGASTLTEQTR